MKRPNVLRKTHKCERYIKVRPHDCLYFYLSLEEFREEYFDPQMYTFSNNWWF